MYITSIRKSPRARLMVFHYANLTSNKIRFIEARISLSKKKRKTFGDDRKEKNRATKGTISRLGEKRFSRIYCEFKCVFVKRSVAPRPLKASSPIVNHSRPGIKAWCCPLDVYIAVRVSIAWKSCAGLGGVRCLIET